MASAIQSNPVYYSLASLNSGGNSSVRTVVLHRRADHDGFGVYIGEDIPSGLYVVTVERNSPATEANIQPGDRVLAINGQPVASLQHDPKEMLIQAAAHASTLTLTIKSTDLFERLDIPPITYAPSLTQNTNRQNTQQFTPRHTVHPGTDLEGYIRSLFADENIQILQAGTQEDIKAASYPFHQPAEFRKTLPARHGDRNSRPPHRRRRPRDRPTLVTVETQTSLDSEENGNPLDERSAPSSSKRSQPARPNMGVNLVASKNQFSNSADSARKGPKPSENPDPSDYNIVSTTGSSDEEIRVKRESSQNSQAARTAMPVSSASDHSKPHTVKANRDAQLKETDDRSRASSAKQTTDPAYTSSAGSSTSRIPAQPAGSSTSRIPAQPAGSSTSRIPQQPTEPSTSRLPAAQPAGSSTSRIPQQPTGSSTSRLPAQPTGQDQPPPPPYTEKPHNAPAVNNRDSTEGKSYNVRTGIIHPTPPSSGHDDNIRNLHLTRQPNVRGFGFHVQYNKAYYLITEIEPNTPAAEVDLRANEVILSINEERTANMQHAAFVQIVSDSSAVDFLVQPLNDYLRVNPPAARHQPAAATTPNLPSANPDQDKPKRGISKVLDKIANH